MSGEEYEGWTIVNINESDGVLLQSPAGNRRRVWFREKEIQELTAEVERLQGVVNYFAETVFTYYC